MKSRIFECKVMHERFIPKGHRFVYRLFMLALDLDELQQINQRSRLLSVNRSNLYSFRESDYLPTDESLHNASELAETGGAPEQDKPDSLKARVSALLNAKDVTHRLERVDTGGKKIDIKGNLRKFSQQHQ